MSIEKLLEREEGFRESVYYCSEGYPTIGIGTVIGPRYTPLKYYTLQVSKEVAYAMLQQELESISKALDKNPVYCAMNSDRKCILQSMAYQLGVSGLMKFKKMWKALAIEDYDLASVEATNSKWANQTPIRAQRHAKVLRSGKLKSAYTF
jgi:lysozyme